MIKQDAKVVLQRAFGQPTGQQIPAEFLEMLAKLDRSKREEPKSSSLLPDPHGPRRFQ